MDDEYSDDSSEFETELYSQVHHEDNENGGITSMPINDSGQQSARIMTNTSVINNPPSRNASNARYWNNLPKAEDRKHLGPVGNVIQGQTVDRNLENIIESHVKPFVPPKPFKPYESYISNIGITPSASKGNPETNGNQLDSKSKLIKNTNTKNNSQDSRNLKIIGPFIQNILKLNRAKMYEDKEVKAKESRERQRRNVETIVLDSSEEDCYVIEVPVPSPPLVTIYSSEDSDIDVENSSESFVKPFCVKPGDHGQNISRCASPSSIISDDFIGHSDRSRLLEESNIVDDQDLQCVQETVSVSENETTIRSSNKNKGNKPTKITTPNYQVTQSNFRAVDIYESESSDVPESIYNKGKTKQSNINEISSNSENDEDVEFVPKLKKLRKRKASGSNKGSEPNDDDDSTDTEKDDINENILPPFMLRGEAVEKCKAKTKKRTISKRLDVNSSDNEFINQLSAIVQGNNNVDNSDVSEDSDSIENVTARELVEGVLQKRKKKQDSEKVSEVENLKKSHVAVPENILVGLDQVLTQIDEMPVDYESDTKKTDEYDEEEYENEKNADEQDQPQFKVPFSKNDSKNDLMTVVHANPKKFIGWNEEMIRFYQKSWHGENFNVASIHRDMRNDRQARWDISTKDKYPSYRRYSNIKCNNCSEFGHMRAKCPKPRKPLICYMCSQTGHLEPRCPNTICLRCGKKTSNFMRFCNFCAKQKFSICPTCRIRGHTLEYCPDKWRRYHSTLEPNELLNDKVEYNPIKHCCICAKSGHLPEHCRASIKFLDFPPPISEIKSHAKAYKDVVDKTRFDSDYIGYNLLYKPNKNFEFSFTKDLTDQQFYSRVLSAVGLETPSERKQKLAERQKEEEIRRRKNFVINPFAKKNNEKIETITSRHDFSFVREMANLQEITKDDQLELNFSTSGNEIHKFQSPKINQLPKNVKCTSFPIFGENIEKNNEEIEQNNEEQIEQNNEDQIEENNEEQIDQQRSNPNVTYTEEQINVSHDNKDKNANKKVEIDQFKISDNIPEKSDICEMMSPTESVPNENLDVAADSDSNYSFSEAFGSSIRKENVHEVTPMPDYIPLTLSDDNEDDTKLTNDGISYKHVSQLNCDDNFEKSKTDTDTPCEAKVYLTAFYHRYLLSPDGNSFLIESSKKYNVKTQISSSSVGSMIIINGLPQNQDKFHKDLLEIFRKHSDKMNRQELERSQKVPRRRDLLIKHLQTNILQLEDNLGNVNELFKRLQSSQNQVSKIRWRQAEKARKNLNMILIGQTGLKNGKVHMESLQNNLKDLLEDKSQIISNEFRSKIDEHWKYIFTSYQHENYEEMIQQYNEMKKNNELPKLILNYKILGKRFLDVSLTKEQKEKLEKPKNIKPQIIIDEGPKDYVKTKMVLNPMSLQKTVVSNNFKNDNDPTKIQPIPENNEPSTSGKRSNLCISEKILQCQNDKNWEKKCDNLFNEINSNDQDNTKTEKNPSIFWSRECIKKIEMCLKMGSDHTEIVGKLNKVMEKAEKGLLSFNDHKVLSKIFMNIKGKVY